MTQTFPKLAVRALDQTEFRVEQEMMAYIMLDALSVALA